MVRAFCRPSVGCLAVQLLVAVTAPRAAAVPQAAPAPTETQQEFLARLAEFARSAPVPERRAGDHALRGRVLLEDGGPCAGVRLRARRTEFGEGIAVRHAFADAPDDTALARSLLASASFWFSREENTWETTSGADGAYVFEGLVDGRFEIEAWSAGFFVEPVQETPFRRIAVDVDSTVDFVAHPTRALAFDLRLSDGTQPERAQLELVRVGETNKTHLETWTLDTPEVRLPLGDWRVIAYGGGRRMSGLSKDDATFTSERTSVAVTADGPDASVPLQLHGKPAIEGKVRVESTARVSLRVVAVPLPPGKEPDPKLISAADRARDRSVLSASVDSSSQFGGTFLLAGVTPGRWLVGLCDYRKPEPLAIAVVEVGEGPARHDFVLAPEAVEKGLRVRVRDPDGGLLRDVSFEHTSTPRDSAGRGGRTSGGVDARKLADGSFLVALDDVGAECTLFARNPRFGTRVTAVPNGARELEVRFVAPATPSFRLTRFAERARDRHVVLEVTSGDDPERARPQRFEGRSIAADGTIDLGRFQPGDHLFWLFVQPRPGEPPSRRRSIDEREIGLARFTLAAGPSPIEMEFPELGTLRISGMPAPKAEYWLVPLDPTPMDESRVHRVAASDEDGVVVFDDVPPGTFQFRGPKDGTMEITTPAAGEVRFVADAIRVLRVTIRDRAGPLATRGLVSGDRIVAIDGREFASREELEKIRGENAASTELMLTVQRGAARFEVLIERRWLDDAEAAGGRFVAAPR